MRFPPAGGALCKPNEMRPVPAGSGRARVYLCFRWPRKSTKTRTRSCFGLCATPRSPPCLGRAATFRRDGAVGRLKVRSRLIDASRPRHAAVARLWRRRPGTQLVELFERRAARVGPQLFVLGNRESKRSARAVVRYSPEAAPMILDDRLTDRQT